MLKLTALCDGGLCPRCHSHVSAIADFYALSGGLASVDDLIVGLRERGSLHPMSILKRSIANRSLIAFSLNAQLVFPRAQFDEGTGLVLKCVQDVLGELRDVYDDLEVAAWFVRENTCLGNQLPWHLLLDDEHRLLASAREARFVARG